MAIFTILLSIRPSRYCFIHIVKGVHLYCLFFLQGRKTVFCLKYCHHETTRISCGGCDLQLFSFYHETTRFSRGGFVWKYFQFSPRDHEIISWWMTNDFFFLTMRPQDFFVVSVCDNKFNFHHKTTRLSCVDVTDNFFFTMRPQDFLVVGVCDNIVNFHHETTRLSRVGCY